MTNDRIPEKAPAFPPGRKDSRDILRALSDRDFLSFGLNHIAYVKPLAMEDDAPAWSVHAADGTPLTVMPTVEEALAALRANDLKPVRLH